MNREVVLFGLAIVVLSIVFTLPGGDVEYTTGRAVLQGQGCCLTTCTDMSGFDCPAGDFLEGISCFDAPQCNLGCCIDGEGYCYTNYVKDACEKEGNQFLGARECGEYKSCLIAPPAPADQEGYLFTDVDGVLLTQATPQAVRIGDNVVIQAHLLQPADHVEVKLHYEGTLAFSKTLDLYDDGVGKDDVKGDDVYSGKFDTSTFPSTGEISAVGLQAVIDGEEKGVNGTLFITPNECVPTLFDYDGEAERHVLFAARHPVGTEVGAFGEIVMRKLVGNIEDYELYHVVDPIQKQDAENVCLVDTTLIYLDNNQANCEQKGSVVHVHPDFGLRNKEVSSPEFLDDFCSYVFTEESIEAEIFRSLNPPVVKILNVEQDDLITDERIELQFIANDTESDRLRFVVYLSESDNEVVFGYMDANTTVEVEVPLQDGVHDLIVEVEDMDYLTHADGKAIRVEYENFLTESNTPEDFNTFQEVKLPFTVSHDVESSVTYYLLDGHKAIDVGTAIVGEETLAEAFLTPGMHDLSVLTFDSKGRRSRTNTIETNVSLTPNVASITGAAISFEFFSPEIDSPFPQPEEGGNGTDEPSGDGKTFGVDDSGFYEPQLLCFGPHSANGSGDTGVRYRPVKCLDHENTTITADARSKTFLDEDFTYEVEYSIESCSEEVLFDVYFFNRGDNFKEEIQRGTLGLGFSARNDEALTSEANFTEFCIEVSDEDVEDQPLCFAFDVNECENQQDDDEDGLCDVGGCVINGETLPPDPGCSNFFDDHEGDGTSACQDGVDNDADGLVDSSDPGCFDLVLDGDGNPTQQYDPLKDSEDLLTSACQDGQDNDADGLVDMDDPGCSTPQDEDESDGTTVCQDGIDNDNDNLCDFSGCIIDGVILQADPGCESPQDTDETDSAGTCDLHDTTQLQKQVIKVPLGNEFRYDISYTVSACKETISYRTCLSDVQDCTSAGAADLESSRIVFLEQESSFSNAITTSNIFNNFCIQTSDTDFGNQCFSLE